MVLDGPGRSPIILDLGTGLHLYGAEFTRRDMDGAVGEPFRGTALLTHLHWDHVQGIPFFAPLLSAGAELDLHAPVQAGEPLADVVRGFLSPPYFPVELEALPGQIRFHDTEPGRFQVDDATVTAAWVPHVGPTFGYRVERDGRSVAYVSDHQQPTAGPAAVDPAVLEICRDVDLLIHDAQYDDAEFAQRPDWGHCTVDYAVEVAAASGAHTLALFHHDPSHGDDVVDRLARGLDTQLGVTWDEGAEVSFGQWQKLALARGFMRDDPLLLVLDEPTAALDAETEHALFERFADAARRDEGTGRVTVLVSHRFSTVRMADLIVVLDGNRVAEVGTHDELMARDGQYASLFRIQAAAYRA